MIIVLCVSEYRFIIDDNIVITNKTVILSSIVYLQLYFTGIPGCGIPLLCTTTTTTTHWDVSYSTIDDESTKQIIDCFL